LILGGSPPWRRGLSEATRPPPSDTDLVSRARVGRSGRDEEYGTRSKGRPPPLGPSGDPRCGRARGCTAGSASCRGRHRTRRTCKCPSPREQGPVASSRPAVLGRRTGSELLTKVRRSASSLLVPEGKGGMDDRASDFLEDRGKVCHVGNRRTCLRTVEGLFIKGYRTGCR
jgi:hypothetical protein